MLRKFAFLSLEMLLKAQNKIHLRTILEKVQKFTLDLEKISTISISPPPKKTKK